MKNIVIIGGGTGLSTLTRSILNLEDISVTSVVTVADNGGSTGVLRSTFNIPAVGDIRRVIGAMSPQGDLMAKMLEYRFDKRNKGLEGHTLGNLILTALIDETGDLSKAVKWLSDYMQASGDVFSVSDQELTLMAEYEDGTVSEGEVSLVKNKHKMIKNVFYKEKDAKANLHVIQSIKDADIIIFGIGSLYSSIIPNILFKEVQNELSNSKAKKIYVANIMEEPGETVGYSLGDHVNKIESYAKGMKIDNVLFNNGELLPDTLSKYKKSGQNPIVNDLSKDIVIEYDLVSKQDGLIRHDEKLLMKAIKEIL